MTISNHIAARLLNDRYGNFERCAEEAPAGAYEQAKAITAMIGQTADALIAATRALGLKADNCDRIREVEAVLYGYLIESNPDETVFAVSEGFGAAMAGPARDRVLASCHANVAFLAQMRAAPQAGASAA